MTEEQKVLLLKDLCARLQYGVKILHKGWNFEWDQELSTLEKVTGIDERFIYTKVIDDNGKEYTLGKYTISLFDDKPYLFPLSSMTEEQYDEMEKIVSEDYMENIQVTKELRERVDFITHFPLYCPNVIDWLNKNHFDYRGLIPMGLANDATGLNIY